MIKVTKRDRYILIEYRDGLIGNAASFVGPTPFKAGIREHLTDPRLIRIGPIPKNVAPGVYTMILKGSDKKYGCAAFTLKFQIDMHRKPAMPIKHKPTHPRRGDPIIECGEWTDFIVPWETIRDAEFRATHRYPGTVVTEPEDTDTDTDEAAA